jgi:dihydrofolate reductase
MRRVRYNVAATLDGFIADPNGGYDWIVMDESIDFPALFREFDAFVMGRKTWDVSAKTEFVQMFAGKAERTSGCSGAVRSSGRSSMPASWTR